MKHARLRCALCWRCDHIAKLCPCTVTGKLRLMQTKHRTIRCAHGFDASAKICPECHPAAADRAAAVMGSGGLRNPCSKPGGRRYKTRELVRR